jgi:hypothetical protein
MRFSGGSLQDCQPWRLFLRPRIAVTPGRQKSR